MQDFESSPADAYDLSFPRSTDDDPQESEKGTDRPSQREGLPAHYRMRAERHYVDSITSGSAGVPIRLIPLSQFEAPGQDGMPGLEALIKSVRVHGIIQPLLVRKRHTRYEVIAGRRRFAAAAALGLTEVPCVLHQVDDAGAAALGAAENIHASPQTGSLRAAVGAHITEAIGRIADDVGRLQTSLAALRVAPEGFERTITTDLAAAQACRALWLANTVALLAGGKYRDGRRRLLSAILDDLMRQLEPECRLSGLRIDVTNTAPPMVIDDGFITVGLTGAVMMTLSLLEQVARPAIEISTRELEDGGLAAQVVQRHVPVASDMIDRFASRTRSAWTPMIFALSALSLEHATAAHGGAADLTPLEDAGSAVQLTFCRV